MKNLLFLIFSLLTGGLGCGCSGSLPAKSNFSMSNQEEAQQENVHFTELRRLNREVDIEDIKVITTFKQTSELYAKLDEKKFSRSAPIPTLDGDEFLVVLKPAIQNRKFNDIEITKINVQEKELKIYYREIVNSEYAINQKSPIIILKVEEKVPSGVQLINN